MSNSSGEQKAVTARYSFFVFVLLFLLYFFDYTDRLVIVSLFPFMKNEWGITDTQCGLLISAVYWSILVFSFPASVLVDRWSRKKSIGLMGLIWSLATLACAFTRNFGQLFSARALIGIGEAGYAPGGTAMISALFPPEKRARFLGYWNASIPLGSAFGIALGGLVAEHYGWRHAFGLVALPGIILAILFFFIRDYKTVELLRTEVKDGAATRLRMSRKDAAREFAGKKSLIFNNLAFAASVFVTTSLMTWLPTYLNREYGMPMTEAGVKGSLIMMFAIVGAPLGGFLADKWLTVRPNARMLFPAATSLISGIMLFAAFGLFQGRLQYVVLMGFGVVVTAFIPAAVAVTQDVVHPGLRATSLSINIIIQHLFGSALGPLFVGAVSDARGLKAGLISLPFFLLLSAMLFFAGSFFYVRDLSHVEEVEISFE